MKYVLDIEGGGVFIDYHLWDPVIAPELGTLDLKNSGKDVMELLLNATEVFLDG